MPLTTEQEWKLHSLDIPESAHARIEQMLTTRTEDSTWSLITTVEQALAHFKYEQANPPLVQETRSLEEVAQDYVEFNEQRKKDATTSSLSQGARAYNAYVVACQNRKIRLSTLKAWRATLRATIRSKKLNADSRSTVVTAGQLWANEQLQTAQLWIAEERKRKFPEEQTVTIVAIETLQSELNTLDIEINTLELAVPQKADYY